jgi:hypothetical protein
MAGSDVKPELNAHTGASWVSEVPVTKLWRSPDEKPGSPYRFLAVPFFKNGRATTLAGNRAPGLHLEPRTHLYSPASGPPDHRAGFGALRALHPTRHRDGRFICANYS